MIERRGARLPLTGAQSGVWFAQELDPTNASYNIGGYLDIAGPVDPALFEVALRRTVAEAEALRVRIVAGDQGPRQVVVPDLGFSMHAVDVSAEPDAELSAAAWIKRHVARPFDLGAPPLFSFALIKVAAARTFWLFWYHHLVADGATVGLIARRVAEVYSALVEGARYRESPFGSLRALLERDARYRESADYEKDRAYWLEQAAGRAAPARLTARPPTTPRGALRQTAHLPPTTADAVRAAARALGVRWSSLVIAATALYLHQMTGAPEVVLGLPVTTRRGQALRDVPGMVVNVVPLWLRIEPEQSVADLARRASKEIGAALHHQRYWLEDLRHERKLLGDDRALVGPHINVMALDFNLRFGGHPATEHHVAMGPVEDLMIAFCDHNDGNGWWIYFDANPDLYEEDELQRHKQRYVGLLERLTAADPGLPVGRIDVLSAAERDRTRVEWSGAVRELPEAALPELFEAQAARTPEATAIVSAGARLTYAELNARANRLSHRLIALGVGREDRVAIFQERSVDVVVSILAVLKAGGAYVPLDARYPSARMRLIIEDTAASVLLIDVAMRAQAPQLYADVVVVVDADADPSLAAEPDHDPGVAASPEQLAYVMYTSGSTGLPKGVAVTHADVAALAHDHRFRSGAHERVLLHSPLAFDASIYELFVPLLSGGQVVVAPPGELSIAVIERGIAAERITGLFLTTGLFRVIADEAPEALAGVQEVWTGGDVVPPGAIRRVLERWPSLVVVDVYGPTEATTFATCHVLRGGDPVPSAVPIGRPLDNMRVYVVDSALRPSPPGVIGEIYIAGAGIARGYFGRPGLSATRFVADPFGPPGSRMYRTGDRGCFTSSGELVFAGRVDEQVKVRGFRVELGEIEAALLGHPRVAQGVVTFREDRPGHRQLVAYVVARAGGLSPEELRAHLAAALPEYMVPAVFVVLDALPLNLNGKLDRKALPAPGSAAAPIERRARRAPRTPREELLCRLFAEVLGLSAASIDDNFFALGGDSIISIQLVSRARRAGLLFTPRDVFQCKTVEALAAVTQRAPDGGAAEGQADARDDAMDHVLPLSPLQEGLLFHALYDDQAADVYTVQLFLELEGALSAERLEVAARALLRRHPNLRAAFRHEGLDRPVQLVPQECSLPFRCVDLSGLGATEGEQALAGILAADRARRFDMASPPLVRCALIRLADDRHRFVLTNHHILLDGWSMPVLRRELCRLYRQRGDEAGMPPVAPYRGYLAWLGAQDRGAAEEAWRSALAGVAEPTLVAPASSGRVDTLPEQVVVDLGEATTSTLVAWARRSGLTMNTLVQGAWAILLGWITSREDVVFGATVSGRPPELPGVEEMVGLFINTLPVRVRLCPADRLLGLLVRLQDEQSGLMAHQHVRLTDVQRMVGIGRLFDTMMVFENYPVDAEELDMGGAVRVVGTGGRDATHYPLTLGAMPGQSLKLLLGYQPDLFERATVEGFAARLARYLVAPLSDPDVLIGQIDALAGAERGPAPVDCGDARLTSSGKVDRKALPPPDFGAASGGRAPRTPREEVLCQLFAEVLRLPAVGVDDSFFELGGDSIMSIQLVGRARRAGVVFTPRDVFQQRTAEALAAVASDATEVVAEDARGGAGSVPLTPIIHWLRELGGPIDGFNQSVLLQAPAGLSEDPIAAVMQAVVDHHDALRMRLIRQGDAWRLEGRPRGAAPARGFVRRVDVAGLKEDGLREVVRGETEAAAGRLAPEAGAMVQVVWFDAGPERPGRLLLMVHHLAVDGVSWRILVPDVAAAGQAVAAGRTPALPPVGASFRQWATQLQAAAQSPARAAELSLWTRIAGEPEPSLTATARPLDPERDVAKTARHVRMTLAAEVTGPLLTRVPAAFHARINDVLLTALALSVAAFRERRGSGEGSAVLIDLEGHGREQVVPGLDVSRTVGWFTSAFPVRLDTGTKDWRAALAGGPLLGAALKRIKEQLRALPDNGVGYGLLRYLNPQTGPALARLTRPQLGFNYLGRFAGASAAVDWGVAPESAALGAGGDPGMPLAHAIEVNALTQDHVNGPELLATWSWPEALFSEGDIRELAATWFEALRALTAHVEGPHAGGHSPSDFPLVALTQAEIDLLEAEQPRLDAVLPLSPLQDGLLFHALYDAQGSDVYSVQLVVDFAGPLDGGALRAAARALLRRHANLRAGFQYVTVSQPVQLIAAEVELPWCELDLSAMDRSAAEAELARLLAEDRGRRFDLTRPPLMRGALIRHGADQARFVLTCHHILLDGWSMPLLMQEILSLYQRRGDDAGLPRVIPYADYLAWLVQKDRGAAEAAWRQALRGVNEPTLLAPAAGALAAAPERLAMALSEELTAALCGVARQNGLTVNTLLQGAWGLLLGRLTARDDVIFGAAVSGRPADLPGVESMIGLLINTVPVRVRVDPAETLLAMLTRLQDEQSQLIEHHHLGLRAIKRVTGLRELFDTMVVFENYPVHTESLQQPLKDIGVVGVESEDATHYPLSIAAWLLGERLQLRTTYRPDLVSRETARRLLAHLARLLEAMVVDPKRGVVTVNVLDPAERNRLLAGCLGVVPLPADEEVDRGSSPAPALHPVVEAPRTPQEEALCGLFADVLGLPSVGVDDSFFALGGHSLLAARLVSRVRSAFGVDIAIRTLFENPTVAGLARQLGMNARESALGVLLPLRAGQGRAPLFCIHPAAGIGWGYGGLPRYIGPDIPVYALQARGLEQPELLPRTVDEMAADYLAELRLIQPAGPYHLLGWSFGGVVAHVIATRLQAEGEEVALLAMMDAYPLRGRVELSREQSTAAVLQSLGHDLGAHGERPLEPAQVSAILRRDNSALATLTDSEVSAMVQVFVHNIKIGTALTPGVFRGDLLFFTAAVGRTADAPEFSDWAPHVTGAIENHALICKHGEMTQPEPLARIGRVLSAKLSRIEGRSQN